MTVRHNPRALLVVSPPKFPNYNPSKDVHIEYVTEAGETWLKRNPPPSSILLYKAKRTRPTKGRSLTLQIVLIISLYLLYRRDPIIRWISRSS